MDQLSRREEVLKAFREMDAEAALDAAVDAAIGGEGQTKSPGGWTPTMPDDCESDCVMVGLLLTTTWMGEEYVEMGCETRVPLKGRSNEDLMKHINKTVYNTLNILLRETVIELGERFEHERNREADEDNEGNEGNEDGEAEGV